MQPQNSTLQSEIMAVTSCKISNNLAVDFKASPATTPAVYAIRPDATRQVRIAYEYVEEPQRFQALALLSPDVTEPNNTKHQEKMKNLGCTPEKYFQKMDHKTNLKEVIWQLSEHGYGRFQPSDNISLATMQRRSRNTIINDYCYDFDIVAAVFSVTLNKAEADGASPSPISICYLAAKVARLKTGPRNVHGHSVYRAPPKRYAAQACAT
jgi:hypothetical protein